jgi:glycerol-3-phosphate dehydrogenase (NAD(P)+)
MSGKIAVIGGGSWGATLADVLGRNGRDVVIWEFFPQAAEALASSRTLKVMPDLKLHPSVKVTSDLAAALAGAELVVSAVPSEHVRRTWRAVREKVAFPKGAWALSVTKGIENDSLKRMSEIIVEEVPAAAGRVGVLAGPSHAEEVARQVPTAVVAAGPSDLPGRVQKFFQSDSFRVYTSPDALGVELGGALKNIYAIACGVCDGLGLGDNTKAALMTRGLNEMTRAGIALGASSMTFSGLSGLGDLIVTCTSRHSRNRSLGEKIGQGKNLQQALAEMTMVAEGVATAKSGYQLAKSLKLDLPIILEIYRCLHEGKPAREALRDLMTRPVSEEMSQVSEMLGKAGRP